MHSLNFSFILEDNCNVITYKFAGYQSSIPDFKHKHGELSSSPPSPHPLTPHHHHPQHDLISSSLFFSPSSSSSFLHIIQQKIIPQRTKYQPFPFPEATLHPLSPSITQSIQLKKNKNKIERRLSPFYTLQLNIHSNMPCFKLNGE